MSEVDDNGIENNIEIIKNNIWPVAYGMQLSFFHRYL